MKKQLCICGMLAMGLFYFQTSQAQCGVNILLNPGFESPAETTIGNHIPGTTDVWAINGGPFNIVRTDGSFYNGGPNNAQAGVQYVDIANAAGTITQDFNVASATSVSFGGYFSSRESAGYTDWTASIQIYSLPALTLVATSATRNFTMPDGDDPAQENWYLLTGTVSLPAGNYRYVINLGDYGNFDEAFVFTNCVLPIRISSFSADYKNDAVSLQWNADQASGFSHFEVERSTNARDFYSIGKLGLSNTSLYTFRDGAVEGAKKYFYRLKMVDVDGSIRYSGILSIHTKGALLLNISPNPATTTINVSGLAKEGVIKITDLSGRTVMHKTVQSQSIVISIAHLNAGMYLLQYFDGSKMHSQKLMRE